MMNRTDFPRDIEALKTTVGVLYLSLIHISHGLSGKISENPATSGLPVCEYHG